LPLNRAMPDRVQGHERPMELATAGTVDISVR